MNGVSRCGSNGWSCRSISQEFMGKRRIISQLPRDIVVDILSRLPVKSLIRFKCVSKPCRSLISDPQFAKLQLDQFQKTSNVNIHQVLLSTSPPVSIDYEAYHGDEDETKVTSELEYPEAMNKDPEYDVDLVGSCNGLVCLLLDDDKFKFILWNPSTRESRVLPEPSSSVPDGMLSYGLGYDFSSNDYKLLRVYCPANVSNEIKAEDFSLKTNVWKSISNLPSGIEVNGNGIFLTESLYWLGKQGSGQNKKMVIVTFNLAEEKFQEVVEVPDRLEENNVAVLGVSGDCLCLTFESNDGLLEGWLMKEFGVKSSWTRLFGNPVDPLPGYKYWQSALCYTKTGKVLIDHDGWDLLIYDPREQTTKKFTIRNEGDYFHAIIYTESLVSPYLW